MAEPKKRKLTNDTEPTPSQAKIKKSDDRKLTFDENVKLYAIFHVKL